MGNLEDYKKDVFEKVTTIEDTIVSKYYKYNEIKKKAEKWLKDHGSRIKEAMTKLGADKKDFGKYRVSISIPDASKFDEDEVVEFIAGMYVRGELSKKEYESLIIIKPNEDQVAKFIESGKINLDDLKAAAWKEAKGSPRLNVTDVGKEKKKK